MEAEELGLNRFGAFGLDAGDVTSNAEAEECWRLEELSERVEAAVSPEQ